MYNHLKIRIIVFSLPWNGLFLSAEGMFPGMAQKQDSQFETIFCICQMNFTTEQRYSSLIGRRDEHANLGENVYHLILLARLVMRHLVSHREYLAGPVLRK